MSNDNKRTKSLLLSLFIVYNLIFIASISNAGNSYFVSSTGNAAWTACTNASTPCSASTAMANAQAGDLVYFRSGTYNPGPSCDRETPALSPSHSGTAGSPITFKAYPGEIPVIQGITCGGPSFGTKNVEWIVWDGFTGTILDKTGGENRFVMFVDSNHITIRNCDLHGVVKTDYHNNALIESLRSSYVTIENNILHDNNGDPSVVANTTAILFWDTSYAIIKNNDIYNNTIGIYDKQDGIANAYYNNHIWGGAGTQTCNIGFQIKNQMTTPTGHDDQFYFNVVRNCGMGVYNEEGTASDLMKNVKIYNNVFYSGSAGIHLSGQATNTEVFNNIIANYQNALRYTSGTSMSTNLSNYNIFYPSSIGWNLDWGAMTFSSLGAWTATTTFDTNSSVMNPQFSNAGGVNPADFKLKTGSPAYTGGRGGSYPSYRGAYSPGPGNQRIGRLNPPRDLR